MRRLIRALAALTLVGLAAGCANVDSGPNATPEVAARAAYAHDGPPALTLYTMVNNRSQAGAHTSLMVNGAQRVIFDPSGSVRFSAAPEIDDVLYGITPVLEEAYASAHARAEYHVRIQRVEVPRAVADRALALVQANGPVPASLCTSATAGILRQLPGFDSLPVTLFPNGLADSFALLPGVAERRVYEDDGPDKAEAIALIEAGQTP